MLKLNVGLSRKVGEANFGSRGASVNLEIELESGLVGQDGRLQERIRSLFQMAKGAVEAELNGNGHVEPANNGGNQAKANGRLATASQVRAIGAIAQRAGVNLSTLLRDRFHVGDAVELSIVDASALIDELKSQTNGAGGRR